MNHDRPSMDHRFMACFTLGLLPDPISLRFSRISGLGHDLQAQRIHEGGHNAINRYLPRQVTTQNLVFERGVMAINPLTVAADIILNGFDTKLMSIDILILLLNDKGVPEASWMAEKAMPVRMSTGALDAGSGQVLINTMEFACKRVEWLGIKR
ncbi:phage tail protein [Serratia rubidaea]|uniref:phage tail protein n=1 Tax=Serratia rubidaea TaxID=61652 RepID=UPI0017808A6E|nr:phage tail protein [Serratia rubidaea]MBD8451061.1 phage tail protein [Serratia rubidaea]